MRVTAMFKNPRLRHRKPLQFSPFLPEMMEKDLPSFATSPTFSVEPTLDAAVVRVLLLVLVEHVNKGLFHLIEGHRRVFASRRIIEEMLAGAVEGQPPPDTEPFEWIPVSVEPPRQSRLTVLIRMQSSDALKDPWNFKGRLEHIRHIYEEYQREKGRKIPVDELPESLARAVGWPVDKMRIMVQISQSKVLSSAVAEYESCSYKGWYHLVQISNVLLNERAVLIEQITSVKTTAKVALREAIYKLLVGKVRYYVESGGDGRVGRKKAQPGSLLERCGPVLRDERFPAGRIADWLTKDIDLTPGGMFHSVERLTEASLRHQIVNRFLKAWAPGLTEQELSSRMMAVMRDETNEGTDTGVSAEDTQLEEAGSSGPALNEEDIVQIRIPRGSDRPLGDLAAQIVPLLRRRDFIDQCSVDERVLARMVADNLAATIA